MYQRPKRKKILEARFGLIRRGLDFDFQGTEKYASEI